MTTSRFLEQVTVTGADDSVYAHDLYTISKRYPFVEWGILLSKNNEGSPRFPSRIWLSDFLDNKVDGVQVSGHICGTWVRDIVAGGTLFRTNMGKLVSGFNRFQLNFHAQPHRLADADHFIQSLALLVKEGHQQIILQRDDVNDIIYEQAVSYYARDEGVNAVALFDTSGGTGRLPFEWVQPTSDYCGYAGGLSPDNVVVQLGEIRKAITNRSGSPARIWIDAETHLRSKNDEIFDLDKVVDFLENAKPFVIESSLRGIRDGAALS